MIRIGTLEASLANRRPLSLPNGTRYFKSDLILSQPDAAISPQAFIIEQEPGSTIRPHFHQENQFQVVVAGEGHIGRHEVVPISLHYASRHTGYGPVVAGERGVTYLTLRDRFTIEAWYLPDSKHLMEDVPRRNLFAERIDVEPDASLQKQREGSLRTVIAPEPDGVAACVVSIAPRQAMAVPTPAGGADRFHLVIAGELVLDAQCLRRGSIVFASADEAPLPLNASGSGAQVLVMQYPAKRARGSSR